jgi:hypothetical protein
MERETRIELATLCLGSKCSTTQRLASTTTIFRTKTYLIPQTKNGIAIWARRLSQFEPIRERYCEFGGPVGTDPATCGFENPMLNTLTMTYLT